MIKAIDIERIAAPIPKKNDDRVFGLVSFEYLVAMTAVDVKANISNATSPIAANADDVSIFDRTTIAETILRIRSDIELRIFLRSFNDFDGSILSI